MNSQKDMSYEAWKRTYDKILDMYSEFGKLIPESPELSKCWKNQQAIQSAWEKLNYEYLRRYAKELLNSIQKGK